MIASQQTSTGALKDTGWDADMAKVYLQPLVGDDSGRLEALWKTCEVAPGASALEKTRASQARCPPWSPVNRSDLMISCCHTETGGTSSCGSTASRRGCVAAYARVEVTWAATSSRFWVLLGW